MMKQRIYLFLGLLTLSSDFFYTDVALAQRNKEPKKDRKYINLVVGLDENVKMPYMPRKYTFKGNFKRFTSVKYLKEFKTLRFSPKRQGSATLTIQDRRGRIVSEFFLTVRKSNLNRVAKEIQSLLSEIDGVTVKIIDNKVIVDGQVLLPKELSRIHTVVEQYGNDRAANFVTLSPVSQRKIAEFIERDINNPQIHVRNVNGKFLLEGMGNASESNRAYQIAQVYFPDVEVIRGDGKVIRRIGSKKYVINLIKPPPPAPKQEKPPDKLIQIMVHFVELNKDYQKSFRFQWQPDIKDGSKLNYSTGGDALGLGGIVGTITGTISNLLPKLNWAKSHGHARVLKSTSVIVKDGKKGEINQLSKIPYQELGEGGTTGTAFVDVGITSTITPSVKGANDNIELEVGFDVSAVSGQLSNGQPIIAKNKIQTTVVVRSRQSAAIGGIVSQTSNTGYNKIPNTSENPLISLLASKDFLRKQSQFVVFVTPVIKSSASSGTERIKRKFRLSQ